MFNRFKQIYAEFPRKFWIVVGVSFIDRVGGTLLFPFFSLYITQKFNVGMTQAGMILGLFAIFGLFGGMIGGALTDKFGRRKLILFGLVFSAISTLSLGLVNQFNMLIPIAVIIGLLSDVAGPAHSAMIADILPDKQRQEGFGILRIVGNMAWIIGPTIGGFVANRSFFALFVIDAIVSCIVALLFFLLMPETMPERGAEQPVEGVLATFKGYGIVARDLAYMAFLLAGMLMGLVYQQMYNSLSVYLRDVHGIQPQGYGFLLTTSAITVILLQLWVTRIIKHRPPFAMMALGTIFYLVGFGMFGFVSVYWLFALAIVIITLGEMIVIPTSQALAANFAPDEMRGRYMAVFGLIWMLPALCGIAALGFYGLHARIGRQERFAPAVVETAEAAEAAI